jgi:hypothetical protein
LRKENQIFIQGIHFPSILPPRAAAPLARTPLLSSPCTPLCRLSSKCVEYFGSECSELVSENWTLHFPVNLPVTHALTCVGHSTKTPGFKHLQHSDVVAGSRTPERACIIIIEDVLMDSPLLLLYLPEHTLLSITKMSQLMLSRKTVTVLRTTSSSSIGSTSLGDN